MLEHCVGLVLVPGYEARRKAYRVYADRVESGPCRVTKVPYMR